MKYSKLMQERIRRTKILFKELGYVTYDTKKGNETYTAVFDDGSSFQGMLFIDSDNKFLELAFSFIFSHSFSDFISEKMNDLMNICYEFGCYFLINSEESEFTLSAYTKVYYVGMNYYALKETLRDFKLCVEELKNIVDIRQE